MDIFAELDYGVEQKLLACDLYQLIIRFANCLFLKSIALICTPIVTSLLS